MIEKVFPKTKTIISISLKSIADTFKNVIRGRISHITFLAAQKEALRRCTQENRKIYVIKSGPVNWMVFSTHEVRSLKKKGVFKKELTFKEMSEKSAFTAFPSELPRLRK